MIQIYPDLESLSRAAAKLFVVRALQSTEVSGRFTVALSGGHTPEHTYQLLAHNALLSRVPWERVHVFWGDERCVPPDDPRCNELMARKALLNHVPVPEKQIHPIRCAGEPQQAAVRYEELLRDFFQGQSPSFDLVFLGLGENGHTASLFPGTPALEEERRWVASVHVAEQDLYRVTLTAPLLNHAAVVAFLIAGAAKAQVLKEVLEEPREARHLPAQLIRPTSGALRWLVDQAAASLVSQRT